MVRISPVDFNVWKDPDDSVAYNLNHTGCGMKGQTAAGKISQSWDLEILVETNKLESRVVSFNYFS